MIRSFELFGEINNLAGTSYRETNLVPMPGRWFSMGLNWSAGY